MSTGSSSSSFSFSPSKRGRAKISKEGVSRHALLKSSSSSLSSTSVSVSECRTLPIDDDLDVILESDGNEMESFRVGGEESGSSDQNQNIPPSLKYRSNLLYNNGNESREESLSPELRKPKSGTFPRRKPTGSKPKRTPLDLKKVYGGPSLNAEVIDLFDFKNTPLRKQTNGSSVEGEDLETSSPILSFNDNEQKHSYGVRSPSNFEDTPLREAKRESHQKQKIDFRDYKESRREHREGDQSTANSMTRVLRSDLGKILPNSDNRPGFSKNAEKNTLQLKGTSNHSPDIVSGISRLNLPTERNKCNKERGDIRSTAISHFSKTESFETLDEIFPPTPPKIAKYNKEAFEVERKQKNLKDLNVKNVFEFVYQKGISGEKGPVGLPTMQFIAAFMREDSTFLIVQKELDRIRRNEYLLRTEGTEALLQQILEKVRLSIEIEYVKMRRVWEQAINTLR